MTVPTPLYKIYGDGGPVCQESGQPDPEPHPACGNCGEDTVKAELFRVWLKGESRMLCSECAADALCRGGQ